MASFTFQVPSTPGIIVIPAVPAAATVVLGGLSQTYTGAPLSATATTVPAGLSVSFTYNGSATPPTSAGSYAVVGTISTLGYAGSANGTLVIGQASQAIALRGAGRDRGGECHGSLPADGE